MQTVNLLSGALTPVIAIIALYIAWQQHATAKGKLKLDLYDRRFKVYYNLMSLLNAVLSEVTVSDDDLERFYAGTNEKIFLFKDDIVDFMTQVRDKALELRNVNRRMKILPDGSENEYHQLVVKDAELLQWFGKQFELAPGKFEKYLGFKRNL